MAISTNGAIITRVAGALYNEYLSNGSYLEVSTTAPATVAANWLSNDFAGKTDAQLAATILTNLGLSSVAGLDNWVAAQLTAAGSTAAAKGAVLVSMLNSYSGMTADATYGTYATSFNAKVAASLVKSQTTGSAGGTFATSDAVSVVASTILLTSGVDAGSDFVGGAGNDTFSGTSNGLLSTGDELQGGDGTDTLTSRHTITADTTIAPNTGSIEIHKVRVDHDGAAADVITYDMTDVVGATKVVSYRSVNAASTADAILTFQGSGMTTSVVLAIEGGDSGADNSAVDVTATYASVTGTADSSTLELNGAAANVVTIAGIETLNITGLTTDKSVSTTGASTIRTLAATSATKVNISAAGTTTLAATDFAAVVAIDASASTGSVRVTTEASTAVTFTGGSGADKVTIGAMTELTAADALNGGDGIDSLVTTSTSLNSTALSVLATELTNFERIEFSTTSTSNVAADFKDLTIFDTIVLSGNATGAAGAAATTAGGAGTELRTFTGIEAGDALVISSTLVGGAGGTASGGSATGDGGNGGNALSLTPELDNGSNSVTITFSNSTYTGGAGGVGTTGQSGGDGGDAIAASSFEIVNIITAQDSTSSLSTITFAGGAGGATGGGTVGNAGASIRVGSNATINVSGAVAVDLGTVAGTNVTINAANLTKALTVTAEAGNNVITGGIGNDTITGGLGLDDITGGDGADVYTIGVGATSTASDAPLCSSGTTLNTSFEVIRGYTAGTDVLNFLNSSDAALTETVVQNAGATSGTANINSYGIATFDSTDDTLAERITAVVAGVVNGGTATAGQFAVFEFSGSTYIYVSDGTDAVAVGDILVQLAGLTGITTTTTNDSGYLVLS